MSNQYDCFANDFILLCEKKNDAEMMVYDLGTCIVNYSYSDVCKYVKRCLTFLRENGVRRGDTIVSIMPNCPEAIVCFFAAMLGGVNYAPIPYSVSKREYDNWLRIVHPELIIKKERTAGFHSDIPTYECKCDGDMSWLPDRESSLEFVRSSMVYLMTSGTTGIPKAISINCDKLWSSGKAFTKFYHIENSMYRFWNYLPMSYLGGLYNLAMIPLCCKGSFVISEPFSGKTILSYWGFVTRHKISALWFVPSIVQGLLKIARFTSNQHLDTCCNEIKISFLGTAPIRLEQKEEFERIFGIHLYENYALSETLFLSAEDENNTNLRAQNSVGKILPYVSLKLIPVIEGENICSIWVKSPFLFEGYLSEYGETKLELDEEGYFDSKDLGYLNHDEILVLSGRNRDIIKKGGQFISLTEIENIVGKLEYIEEVAAISTKHDFYGEVYVLCVNFRSKIEIEKQQKELKTWLKNNFAAYKMPEEIYAYDTFPRTASGKIQKNKLLETIMKQDR